MSDQLMQDMEKTKLEKKLARRTSVREAQEYTNKLENETKEQLEERLLELSKTQQGIINTRNADQELANLKAKVSFQNGEYNRQLTANKELQRLVSLVISDRFGDELMDRKVEADDEGDSSED